MKEAEFYRFPRIHMQKKAAAAAGQRAAGGGGWGGNNRESQDGAAHSSGKNSSVRLEVEIWHMVWLRRWEKPAGEGDL